MTPKLAVGLHFCSIADTDFNAADTLTLLTLPGILAGKSKAESLQLSTFSLLLSKTNLALSLLKGVNGLIELTETRQSASVPVISCRVFA